MESGIESMRIFFGLSVALVIIAIFVAGCGTPPPLKSDKYLQDTSFLASDGPCTTPCFHDIVPGKTTFTDAVTTLKADKAFSNVQTQDKPPQAGWSTAAGEDCCQVTADQDSGLVNALLVKVAPTMTLQQVIEKYGAPKYVYTVDYTADEVAVAVIFPDKGLVTWVSPGNDQSNVDGSSKVVIVLYINPTDWEKVLDTATLQAWNGFQSYQSYKNSTPVVTPKVTPTAG